MIEYYYYVSMFLIRSGVDLTPLFINLETSHKKEILDFIIFLKTEPILKNFVSYEISPEAFKIFSITLDELIKKSV